MSASASLSTRLRPGLFNFCLRSFGLKCSRTPENRNGSGPFYRTGPTHSNKLLVGLLELPCYLGAAAGSLRFGLLLRRVALCLRLVLLGPALASEVVTTSHAPDDFFGLAFGVLDPPQWRTWFERIAPITDPPSDRPGNTARCGTAAQDPEPSATSVRIPMPSHAQTSDAAPRPFMQIVHPAHAIVRRWGRM